MNKVKGWLSKNKKTVWAVLAMLGLGLVALVGQQLSAPEEQVVTPTPLPTPTLTPPDFESQIGAIIYSGGGMWLSPDNELSYGIIPDNEEAYWFTVLNYPDGRFVNGPHAYIVQYPNNKSLAFMLIEYKNLREYYGLDLSFSDNTLIFMVIEGNSASVTLDVTTVNK